MSLSDRFSKTMSKTAPPPANNGRVNRQINQNNASKDKRANQMQGKRGIASNAGPKNNGNAKNNNSKGGRRPLIVSKGIKGV